MPGNPDSAACSIQGVAAHQYSTCRGARRAGRRQRTDDLQKLAAIQPGQYLSDLLCRGPGRQERPLGRRRSGQVHFIITIMLCHICHQDKVRGDCCSVRRHPCPWPGYLEQGGNPHPSLSVLREARDWPAAPRLLANTAPHYVGISRILLLVIGYERKLVTDAGDQQPTAKSLGLPRAPSPSPCSFIGTVAAPGRK